MALEMFELWFIQGLLFDFFGTFILIYELFLDMKGLGGSIQTPIYENGRIKKHIKLEQIASGGCKRVRTTKKELRIIYGFTLIIIGIILNIAGFFYS